MKLEDLRVYQMSMNISDEVWMIVAKWNYFEKDTIGKQVARSADSISANISEGYGRYHFKDSKKFLYYSRGSLQETKTWLTKANSRGLLADEQYKNLMNQLNDLSVKLNNYIKTIGK